ncbi:MAG: 50S ribosomal protein L24 [Candidatus Woesearchaeota archaeon]|nr:50S ribosomal protein L24 [Candidatus Woesearchaeota archaeon]
MKTFSPKWKGSRQPRKQRKYLHNAPLNIKRRMVSAHLSAELRKRYGKRNIAIRKGDKVKVMRGSLRGKTGTIESIDLRKMSVHVSGTDFTKRDGTKARVSMDASNLVVTELNLNDKKRKVTGGKKK